MGGFDFCTGCGAAFEDDNHLWSLCDECLSDDPAFMKKSDREKKAFALAVEFCERGNSLLSEGLGLTPEDFCSLFEGLVPESTEDAKVVEERLAAMSPEAPPRGPGSIALLKEALGMKDSTIIDAIKNATEFIKNSKTSPVFILDALTGISPAALAQAKELIDRRVAEEGVLLSKIVFDVPHAKIGDRPILLEGRRIGSFVTLEDGFDYYWPLPQSQGGYSEEVMKQISLKLAEVNASWKKNIDAYFREKPESADEPNGSHGNRGGDSEGIL